MLSDDLKKNLENQLQNFNNNLSDSYNKTDLLKKEILIDENLKLIPENKFDSILMVDNPKNNEQDQIFFSEEIRLKRILIEFSLIILIISIIFLFGFFFIIKRKFLDIDVILQTKTPLFNCNFILLYIIWILNISK